MAESLPSADYDAGSLSVGDRVLFAPYKRAMTVRAVTTGGRFAILTMPFAAKQTVIYTVIDFERRVRGCDNYYGLGYETDEDIASALADFQATEDDLPGQRAREAEARGETSWPSVRAAEVSHRKYVPLDIVSVLTRVTPPEEHRTFHCDRCGQPAMNIDANGLCRSCRPAVLPPGA